MPAVERGHVLLRVRRDSAAVGAPVVSAAAGRRQWMDALRVLACLAVIVLHVSASVVIDFPDVRSLHWTVGNIGNAFTHWCVPVFVMLSGALLLSPAKQLPVTVFYRKRASRILIPLAFWSVVYTLLGAAQQRHLDWRGVL